MYENLIDKTKNRAARMEVKRYQEMHGAKTVFIAKQTGINFSSFVQWLRGNRDFTNKNVDLIIAFTEEKLGGE